MALHCGTMVEARRRERKCLIVVKEFILYDIIYPCTRSYLDAISEQKKKLVEHGAIEVLAGMLKPEHNIKINDYQFENEFLDWYPALEQFITKFNVDAIVLCSIYSLPEDVTLRQDILQSAIDNNVELHFANELCSVREHKDIKHIEKVLEYKK